MEDLTGIPSWEGPRELSFGLANWFKDEHGLRSSTIRATLTPQQVMGLAGQSFWSELKEGDVVDLSLFGREREPHRLVSTGFDEDGAPRFSFVSAA